MKGDRCHIESAQRGKQVSCQLAPNHEGDHFAQVWVKGKLVDISWPRTEPLRPQKGKRPNFEPSEETRAQYGPVRRVVLNAWHWDRCKGIMVGSCVATPDRWTSTVLDMHAHTAPSDSYQGWICVRHPKNVEGRTQKKGVFIKSGKPSRKIRKMYEWMCEEMNRHRVTFISHAN